MKELQMKSLDYWDIVKEIIEIKKNWRKYLKIIVERIKEFDKNAEVYIFGSAIENRMWGGSDIDILIKPSKEVDHGELIAFIEEKLPFFHPFQFHIADNESWNLFYSKVKKIRIDESL